MAFPRSECEEQLRRNRALGCDTVAGLNEIVRRGKLKSLVDHSIAEYEHSLDEADAKVLARAECG